MRYEFDSPMLKRPLKPFDDAEYEYLIARAKACILWKMTPDYYDSMTMKEYSAWLEAWNDINKEGGTD